MGKVGSSSVVAGIRSAVPERPVFHVHQLRPGAIAREESAYRRGFAGRHRIGGHLLDSLAVREAYDRGRLPPDTVIVTMVRDPIGQRFSAFFQTLEFRMADLHERLRRGDLDPLSAEIAEHFHTDGWWHDEPLGTFFDLEFRDIWGIDVFAEPFDPQMGWRRYSGTFDAVLIRFEDLAAHGPVALGEVLGTAVHLPRLQDSEEKPYADLMDRVRARLELSDDYVDARYSAPAVQHFYSPSELDRFRATWRRTR